MCDGIMCVCIVFMFLIGCFASSISSANFFIESLFDSRYDRYCGLLLYIMMYMLYILCDVLNFVFMIVVLLVVLKLYVIRKASFVDIVNDVFFFDSNLNFCGNCGLCLSMCMGLFGFLFISLFKCMIVL